MSEELKASKERVHQLETMLDQQANKNKIENSCSDPTQVWIRQLPSLANQISAGAHEACQAIQILHEKNHKLRYLAKYIKVHCIWKQLQNTCVSDPMLHLSTTNIFTGKSLTQPSRVFRKNISFPQGIPD